MKTTYHDFKPMLDAGLVRSCLDPQKYIYLTRKDLVLQAISYVRARQSNIWHLSNQNIKPDEVSDTQTHYDENAILRQINGLVTHQQRWERFFVLYSIDPLRITYEEILASASRIIALIGDYINVELDKEFSINDSETIKLGSQENIEWAERYRSKYRL